MDAADDRHFVNPLESMVGAHKGAIGIAAKAGEAIKADTGYTPGARRRWRHAHKPPDFGDHIPQAGQIGHNFVMESGVSKAEFVDQRRAENARVSNGRLLRRGVHFRALQREGSWIQLDVLASAVAGEPVRGCALGKIDARGGLIGIVFLACGGLIVFFVVADKIKVRVPVSTLISAEYRSIDL